MRLFLGRAEAVITSKQFSSHSLFVWEEVSFERVMQFLLSFSTSHSLSLPLSWTLTLSLTKLLSLALSWSHTNPFSIPHSLSLSFGPLLPVDVSLAHSLFPSFSLSHSLTLSLSFSLTLWYLQVLFQHCWVLMERKQKVNFHLGFANIDSLERNRFWKNSRIGKLKCLTCFRYNLAQWFFGWLMPQRSLVQIQQTPIFLHKQARCCLYIIFSS